MGKLSRSEWAKNTEYSKVELIPVKGPVEGSLVVPGSKSITNRALIIAGLAEGKSTLKGLLKSDDSYWCVEALKGLGVTVSEKDGVFQIGGSGGHWPNEAAELYIGSAGTTARFLPGALASGRQGRWTVKASEQMSSRPVGPLFEALRTQGATIRCLENEGFYPIEIEGGGLAGGPVDISGKLSSQFVSGLLISSPYAKQDTEVRIVDHIVQHSYVKITLAMMQQFGATVKADAELTSIHVKKGGYQGRDVTLEADVSTCCYFLALAAVTAGKVRITNIGNETLQPDIAMLDVFRQMGCTVEATAEYVEVQGPARLKGGFTLSMREMSDQTMTVAAIGIFADAPITITEVKHIRAHECDRLSVICDAFVRMGVKVEEHEDGLTVYPSEPKAAELLSHDDHRIAMALSLVGAKVAGIRIDNPGSVSKTCPEFFEMMAQLGVGSNLS